MVLATDGDFNVGVTSRGDLLRLIEEQARSRVFLSVLGRPPTSSVPPPWRGLE